MMFPSLKWYYENGRYVILVKLFTLDFFVIFQSSQWVPFYCFQIHGACVCIVYDSIGAVAVD